jgi:hypothetical protein
MLMYKYIQVALGDLDDMFSSPSPWVKPVNKTVNKTVNSRDSFDSFSTATATAAAPVEVFADPPRTAAAGTGSSGQSSNGQDSNAQNNNAQSSNSALDFVMFEDTSSPGNVHVHMLKLVVHTCIKACVKHLYCFLLAGYNTTAWY